MENFLKETFSKLSKDISDAYSIMKPSKEFFESKILENEDVPLPTCDREALGILEKYILGENWIPPLDNLSLTEEQINTYKVRDILKKFE